MLVFCDECGSIMFPSTQDQRKIFKCKCGAAKTFLEEEASSYRLNFKVEHSAKEMIISTTQMGEWKENNFRSEISDFECPKCHYKKAFIKTVQMRKAHKGMTQYLVCLGCDKIIPVES